MTTVDVGPFRLVDPPEGQESIIRRAIDAIDFPWDRFSVPLAQDSDGAIVVEWDDTGQGVSGLAYGYSMRIVLSTRNYHLDEGAGFVFAHEVGHLVDSATLRDQDREAIMALTHASEFTYRDDAKGETFNNTWWPTAHANQHEEVWKNPDSYQLRHNEAFADQFVAAFAPEIWDGTANLGGKRHPRFVHWTNDHDAIRSLVLWEPPEPEVSEEESEMITLRRIKDVTAKHPKARYIRRAVNLGLMDLRDGRFFPGRRVTRAQVAEMLVKLHDKVDD